MLNHINRCSVYGPTPCTWTYAVKGVTMMLQKKTNTYFGVMCELVTFRQILDPTRFFFSYRQDYMFTLLLSL